MTVRVEKNKNFDLKIILTTIWNEFVYGGHFLALGDVAAMYAISVVLNIPVTWSVFVVIYLCVFAANLLNRSDEVESDVLTNPTRVKIMKKYTKHFYPIVFGCLVISIGIILYYANIKTLVAAVLVVAIAALYTTSFKRVTRYIVGFKNFTAALFYSLMVFPLAFYYDTPITSAVFIVFIFYYVRIFISSAACDVKDIKSDKESGLKTIAIYFGKKEAKRLLNVLNILSGVLIVGGVYADILPKSSLFLLLTIPYAGYYLYQNSKMTKKELFSNVVIDGEFLFWFPYILIGKVLY